MTEQSNTVEAALALVADVRRRMVEITPGPMVVDKASFQRESVHYAIRTRDELPRIGGGGPPCQRSVAWLCGSLGEYRHGRGPEDHRDDPEIEPDARFIAASWADVPALCDTIDVLAARVRELEASATGKAG